MFLANITFFCKSSFQELFKNVLFRSVALVTTKLWTISDFNTDRNFNYPVFKKNLSPRDVLKDKRFHCDGVKNDTARAKKKRQGGLDQTVNTRNIINKYKKILHLGII